MKCPKEQEVTCLLKLFRTPRQPLPPPPWRLYYFWFRLGSMKTEQKVLIVSEKIYDMIKKTKQKKETHRHERINHTLGIPSTYVTKLSSAIIQQVNKGVWWYSHLCVFFMFLAKFGKKKKKVLKLQFVFVPEHVHSGGQSHRQLWRGVLLH